MLFLLCGVLQMIVLTFTNDHHAPMFFGHSPENVWAHDARRMQMNILLAMDLTLTQTAIHVPLRSCVLWVVPTFGLCPYLVLLAVLGSAHPSTLNVTIVLTCSLALASLHGHNRLEKQRRNDWLASQVLSKQVHDQCIEINDQRAKIKVAETIIASQEEELQHHESEKGDQLQGLLVLCTSSNAVPRRRKSKEPAQMHPREDEDARSSSSTSVGDSAPDLSFDGRWVLVKGNAAAWLHSFTIQGNAVTVADGKLEVLDRREGGVVRFSGGVISINNGFLWRESKRGGIQKFKRCSAKERADTNDDRHTHISSNSLSSDVADLEDLGDCLPDRSPAFMDLDLPGQMIGVVPLESNELGDRESFA
jgi:hypothetical protein